MENSAGKIIKNLILDVDGVFNTGQFLYTAEGKYAKVFGPHDNDGIKMAKKYVNICVISADKRGWAITKKRIADDMELRLEFVSEENRLSWLKENFDLTQSVYVGDSIHDAAAFPFFAYSIAPSSAFYMAKEKANYVTTAKAGDGAVAEACFHILNKFFKVTI
jgi:3-deoxy-D-manno-octulosonate 8-phosphate phosphatase (KDO 8-P phosphatase)